MIDFITGYTWYAALFLLLGILFWIIEIFTPGFGWAGLLGFVCLLVSVFLRAETFEQGLWMLIILLVASGCFFFFIFRSFSKGKLSRTKLVLQTKVQEENGIGAYGKQDHLEEYIGQYGESITPLRPAGRVMLGKHIIDVVTDSLYLPVGTMVRVVRVEGRRITVEPMN